MNFGGLFVALIFAYFVVSKITEIDAVEVVGINGGIVAVDSRVPVEKSFNSGSSTPEEKV